MTPKGALIARYIHDAAVLYEQHQAFQTVRMATWKANDDWGRAVPYSPQECHVWGYGQVYQNAASFLSRHSIAETVTHFQMCLASLERSLLAEDMLAVQMRQATHQVLTDLMTS